MALFWRTWTVIMLVNLMVLGVFVGLATMRYASINAGLVGDRLKVLANRTAAPFAAAAGIGLSLNAVRNAPAVLERARQTDDAILAIHVFNASGRIVHSTDSSLPEAIPQAALAARANAEGRPWHRETADRFLSGIEIATRDGIDAGGVLIVYPRGASVTRIWAMAAELLVWAVAVQLLSGTIGAFLLRVGMSRQIEHFRQIDSEVEAFERDTWRGIPAVLGSKSPGGDQAGEPLRGLLDQAERRYLEVREHLAAARQADIRAP